MKVETNSKYELGQKVRYKNLQSAEIEAVQIVVIKASSTWFKNDAAGVGGEPEVWYGLVIEGAQLMDFGNGVFRPKIEWCHEKDIFPL